MIYKYHTILYKGWMKMKKYNKLVRDGLPKIIKESGRDYRIKHLSDDNEFFNELLNKIIEEVEDLRIAANEEEVADIYEIIDNIVTLKGFEPMHIDYIKMKKKDARGTYENRVFLQDVDE